MVVAAGEQKTYFTLSYAYIAFTYKLQKETSLKVIWGDKIIVQGDNLFW